MRDTKSPYHQHPHPTPEHPLLGMTVLVVEDSRFASEAVRMLCRRSGARIRRADSLGTAHKHLSVYRPSLVIVDMGLPDGNGADLIAELAQAVPRVGGVLGMSGDPDAESAAHNAGADGFLAKPVESLAIFQETVLAAMPEAGRPWRARPLSGDVIVPDPLALEDDLRHAVEIMRRGTGAPSYVAQFLRAVAFSAHDKALEKFAARLGRRQLDGVGLARAARVVERRIAGLQVG